MSQGSKHRRLLTRCAIAAAGVFCSIVSSGIVAGNHSVYVTWAGVEPDKGAAAWYIKRVIDESAEFVVVPPGDPLPEGIAFDVPQSPYRRTHNASAFEMLLREQPTDDPLVKKLGALMHDIELNLWRPKVYPETHALESRVKEIAAGLGTAEIPMDCFVAFFDGVYEWLGAGHSDAETLLIPSECEPAPGTLP